MIATSRQRVESIFNLAGIIILAMWELPNQYRRHPTIEEYADSLGEIEIRHLKDYVERAEYCRCSPWWLVKTPIGLIKIGARKRVINIDWQDTAVRAVLTEDDVTKDKTYIHAWTELKAIEYLTTLRRIAHEQAHAHISPVRP